MIESRCGMGKSVFSTSLGWVGVSLSDRGICRIVLPKRGKKTVERELKGDAFEVLRSQKGAPNISRMLPEAVMLLKRYFSGEHVSFDLPLDLRYHTPFRLSVWRATVEIPYGETRSYAWIAKRIGNPRAARAVGQALGANPVPVFIP